MSLMNQLKAYLMEAKSANILDLSRQIQADVAVVRDILQVFIRKGYVCRNQTPAKCGQCQKCNPLMNEIYVWAA